MLAIETTDLTKRYAAVQPALDRLNLSVKKGEVYGFIGRNGAGKTTTINLLLSMIHKTNGTIKINGTVVDFTNTYYKKYIGYVPDVPTFPGYMNAKEYIRYACEMNGVAKEDIPGKIEEVLDFVNLPDRSKRISAYSRGMKQRLAIAQALVHDPEIIIMDEPTSALDPIGRKDVINMILKLKGSKTIFYSTHILEDVEKVCDRIGLLEKGKMILEDSITNIQKKYYQNQMVIKTVEPSNAVYQLLQEENIDNDIKLMDGGIVCQTTGKTSAQDILELLIRKNIHIQEFKPLNASLEDVFIAVTSQ